MVFVSSNKLILNIQRKVKLIRNKIELILKSGFCQGLFLTHLGKYIVYRQNTP